MSVSVCDKFDCVIVSNRSGTDEEYNELSQLLKDIKCYMHDFEQQKATEKSRSDGKKEKDKRKGEEMRNAAMECMSSTSIYLCMVL